jgi:predicted transcriptional regulator
MTMTSRTFSDPFDSLTQRRSKLDIMMTVLGAIRDGVDKPTRIMYTANMSWNSTQKVFEDLLEQDLIFVTEEPGLKRAKKRYHITEKGLNVLQYFEGAKSLIQV